VWLFASKLFTIKCNSKWFCEIFIPHQRYSVSFCPISYWLGECCLIFVLSTIKVLKKSLIIQFQSLFAQYLWFSMLLIKKW
jgi:hypothetical protein